MRYRPYEMHNPLLSPGETLVTPTVELEQRSERLVHYFHKLAALEETFFACADVHERPLSFFERLLALHAGSRATTISSANQDMIQRAWRTHALRTVVAAKLFGLHVAAPGEEVPQDGAIQLAREPRLMGSFVEAITGQRSAHVDMSGRAPFYGLQCLDMDTMHMLGNAPAFRKYGKIEFEYQGGPAPRALPQLPKQISWART